MFKKEIVEKDDKVIGFYTGDFNIRMDSDSFSQYFESEGDYDGEKTNRIIDLLKREKVETVSILRELHISKNSRGHHYGNEVIEEIQNLAHTSPVILLADIETTPWLVSWYLKVGFEIIPGLSFNGQPLMILF